MFIVLSLFGRCSRILLSHLHLQATLNDNFLLYLSNGRIILFPAILLTGVVFMFFVLS